MVTKIKNSDRLSASLEETRAIAKELASFGFDNRDERYLTLAEDINDAVHAFYMERLFT